MNDITSKPPSNVPTKSADVLGELNDEIGNAVVALEDLVTACGNAGLLCSESELVEEPLRAPVIMENLPPYLEEIRAETRRVASRLRERLRILHKRLPV